MAGDWMKVEKDTPEKPEVLGIATRLGVSVGDAFLACFKFWRWADSQTVDGNAPRVTPALLDSICGVTGFADAMREVGWLQVSDMSLVIPNFPRHMGQPAKARALASLRANRHRTAASRNSNAPSVTKTLPEKRREEKRRDKKPPLPPLPFSSPEFGSAWSDWVQHRKEKRHSLTPTSIKQQFTELASIGEPRSIAAIRHSIAKGYLGIYEPSGTNKPAVDLQRQMVDNGNEFIRLTGGPQS